LNLDLSDFSLELANIKTTFGLSLMGHRLFTFKPRIVKSDPGFANERLDAFKHDVADEVWELQNNSLAMSLAAFSPPRQSLPLLGSV